MEGPVADHLTGQVGAPGSASRTRVGCAHPRVADDADAGAAGLRRPKAERLEEPQVAGVGQQQDFFGLPVAAPLFFQQEAER
ncbi:hypothetical protein DQ238_06665 [Geodermatophilus sp. TF02-6]|nr:hypothetical protein DQ238_06665 [Geodermatophilus sp. TF02-6]